MERGFWFESPTSRGPIRCQKPLGTSFCPLPLLSLIPPLRGGGGLLSIPPPSFVGICLEPNNFVVLALAIHFVATLALLVHYLGT